ncbi:protein SCAR3 [Mercurialis annua]|uniref:protein SCAR3 n=1 Tax=Mercurialis annua TaxID=3986 RepID=UPI002160DD05|nr:protein SCAR3 [Mercurialis annua]
MPLVRFEVRNEYRLGQSELYKEANREDPKAVLDGVAVAGLVGILRQLGDLAEFAAEVFHGLQQQVMTTASRSHKLTVRVQNIEAALPSLEKAVLAQTSHIHFAYTAGSEWRSRIQNGQNHFIYNDLPWSIMDSYEECRDPPRLHLLDKFDTGGPGSCLKRYSDPTFFRRASGNFKEPDAEKVPKEKKARKTKKKRSSQRKVDSLDSASMPNQSARMSFTSANVNGQTSPSHTASTTDMTLKSDLCYQSNSFDSRTGSAYVECVFQLNSTAQPQEQDSKEFSPMFMHHDDIADSVISDGVPSIAPNNFHQSCSPEEDVPSSTCDTWDEKAEIMELKGVQFDEKSEMLEPKQAYSEKSKVTEMFTTDSDLVFQNGEIVDHRNSDQIDLVLNNDDALQSSSSKNELDEVDSEPDNFMDALNTIESESENDLDCQTKHEVEQFSPGVEGTEYSIHKDMEHTSDDLLKSEHISDDPIKSESVVASHLSLIKGTAEDSPDSVPSNSFSHEHTSPISGDPCNLDNLPSIRSSTSPESLDSPRVESIFSGSDPSPSGCGILSTMDPSSDKDVSNSCKSQESHAELASIQPVSFWTNGSLLGLEPSKPPDFAVANTSIKVSERRSNGEVTCPPNHINTPYNGGVRSQEKVLHSEHSNSQQADQASEVDKTGDFHHSNGLNYADGEGHKTTAVVKVTSIPDHEENSSQIFGLGHRLLINGFRTKMSLVSDSESELASSLRTGASSDQRNGHCSITYHASPDKPLNEKFGYKTTVDSLTPSPTLDYMKTSFHPSPPLGHMKLSFQPIDGSEASKLNLKFPDGNYSNGSFKDMFTSFQLVPDPTVRQKYSDSDGDTFCRSSPYMSDDDLCHHSDSDSEQWESDESPENKDHELYDALCRISHVDSVSNSVQHQEFENVVDASLSSSMLDLPSFDAVNTPITGKSKDNLGPRNFIELQYLKDPNPSPPPPPPVQWRATKAASSMPEDEQNRIFEAHEHAVDLKSSESTISQQHKAAPANEQQTNEATIAFKLNSKDQWKLNRPKEANRPANTEEIDEKEDFLHQIRTKSFTLRRTATAKPTVSPGPVANDKVTAILEKAIAIRQAVGSDDGEDDDTWSDA